MTINEQTLQELAKQFGLTLDWSNKNIVPYLQNLAQRVITYEFRSSIFWIVIGVIFILIGIIAIVLSVRSDKDYIIGFAVLVAMLLWFVGIVIICAQIDIILCGTLPEKILLNYIQSN